MDVRTATRLDVDRERRVGEPPAELAVALSKLYAVLDGTRNGVDRARHPSCRSTAKAGAAGGGRRAKLGMNATEKATAVKVETAATRRRRGRQLRVSAASMRWALPTDLHEHGGTSRCVPGSQTTSFPVIRVR